MRKGQTGYEDCVCERESHSIALGQQVDERHRVAPHPCSERERVRVRVRE